MKTTFDIHTKNIRKEVKAIIKTSKRIIRRSDELIHVSDLSFTHPEQIQFLKDKIHKYLSSTLPLYLISKQQTNAIEYWNRKPQTLSDKIFPNIDTFQTELTAYLVKMASSLDEFCDFFACSWNTERQESTAVNLLKTCDSMPHLLPKYIQLLLHHKYDAYNPKFADLADRVQQLDVMVYISGELHNYQGRQQITPYELYLIDQLIRFPESVYCVI